MEKFEELHPLPMSRFSLRGISEMDFLCSMIFYTSFIGIDKCDLSERYYCIKNNIKSPVIDDSGRRLKFINRYKGYSVYPDKSIIYDEYTREAKKQISENFNILRVEKTEGKVQINRIFLSCKKCNHEFNRLFKNGLWKKIECPDCNGYYSRSKAENDIIDFLRSIGVGNIILNDRKILGGLELDIYIPDLKIGIEYCGILWHSFGTTFPNNVDKEKDAKYKHQNKMNRCNDLGVRLITIFENDWNLRRDIIKSMLSNKIGKISNRIYARKCQFKEVSKNDSNKFLENNHIQGKCHHSSSFGLYYHDELVSLACFGKRKITRGDMQLELIRFCNKLNYSVVGGASKIIKNSKIGSFISYCDLKYGDGNLYKKLGMRLLRQTKPNYYYTLDKVNLLHRSNFQKHRLVSESTTKTESEIMYERGYRRIYDCGNLVYQYVTSNN